MLKFLVPRALVGVTEAHVYISCTALPIREQFCSRLRNFFSACGSLLKPAYLEARIYQAVDMQEAWQQCRTAGYGLEEVKEVFSTLADSESTHLEGLPLPIAATLKASTTKYALAILPTESGGFGYYKYDDDNDMEDNGKGGNKSASIPSLAAQQAQLISNHIPYSDVNSDKHDSFADTEMVDTDPVTKDPSESQPPISTGNVLCLLCSKTWNRRRLVPPSPWSSMSLSSSYL